MRSSRSSEHDHAGRSRARRPPGETRAERRGAGAHARRAGCDPGLHRQALHARRRRRGADVTRGAAGERDARRRATAVVSERRDARERARSPRRSVPRPAHHRGRIVTTPSGTSLTIHELTERYRRGETRPSETVEGYLERIARLDGDVGAYLTVTREQALAAARASDERYRRGEPLGPLDGAPLAIKAVFCTRSVRTTCGSRILEHFVPPYDATPVARLLAAGAIMLGKTNMDEFAMGSSTEHSALGVTRNPWDLSRVPGGSSGGSAAAVAGELAAAAIGTDTGGSVRQPAAFCGV